jgi:hypothetical protein
MRLQRVGGWSVAVLAGGMTMAAGSARAQDKATMPDAQVESNVLRALAAAPELSTQNIQSTTVYGVVTLTGNVQDEALRSKAENLAARADGVKKVVDELTLGATSAVAQAGPDQQPADAQAGPPPGQVLRSDGTYAPTPPDAEDQGPPEQAQNEPMPQGPPPPQRQPLYPSYAAQQQGQGGMPGGQQAGLPVTIPAGSMLRIRIDRGLNSNHIQPGTTFSGTVLTDVVADGAVAIPRGATVQGSVVDAKKAGALKGRGELSLGIDNVTLGGQTYPLVTEVWDREGRDKTAGTVNRAIGLGALGALFGAAAGGGSGAAIGAAIGGGAGVASSAASPRGQIVIPPESVLTFRVAQPAPVKTVSEQEMSRLSYAAGPSSQPQQRRMRRYYSPYYGYYYGPGM